MTSAAAPSATTRGLLHGHEPAAALFLGGAGDRSAGALAAHARVIGERLASGRPVVLACEDRYAFTAGLVAAWARGCVVHLPPNVRPATVVGVATAAGAEVILHDQSGQVGLDVRVLEGGAGVVASAADLPGIAFHEGQTAAVVYTSGSQGTPTAHAKTLGQLLGEAWSLCRGFALEGRTVLSSVPSHHIYGLLFGVLAPLLAGGKTSRTTPLFPAEVAAFIERFRPEVWVTVPPHLKAFAETDAAPLRPLGRVFSSGAPVPEAVLGALCAAGIPVTQVFGSTETGGIAQREGADPSWRPLPGVTIEITSDDLLTVDSPWLGPDSERPYRTQDRVRRTDSGFAHLGRADSVVKVGGRRVDLGDLEARFKKIAGVRDARVVATDSAGAHGVEILAVVETSQATLTPAVLRQHLAEGLDPVSMPRRIRTVAALPVGAAGKSSRAAVLALFQPPGAWSIELEPVGEGRFRYTPPADLGFFRGHFDGYPVLPAVVQLQRLALRGAQKTWGDLGTLVGLVRVKFRKPVAPGQEMLLALDRRGPQVRFELSVGGEPVSSGTLLFESPRS